MMKWLLVTTVLAAVGLAGNPIVLTDSNFDHDTQIGDGMTTGSWFIKFAAPWCGHCKSMAPAWEQLVEELNEDPINVAEVDATINTELATRFDIRGYPTLLYFNNGNMYKYRGPRDTASFVTFARDGFKTTQEFEIPGRLTLMGKFKKWLTSLMQDLEYIWGSRRSAGAFLMVLGLSFGLSCGFIMGSILAARASLKDASTTAKRTTKRKAN